MFAAARNFFDIYAHAFVRTAVAVPRVRLADPEANAREIGRLFTEASRDGAAVVVFPELALSGYSIDDLHQQDAVLQATLRGLRALVEVTATNPGLLVVGAGLRFTNRLLNCAVVIANGRVLGIAPKSYLPNYREFYEKRQFAAARDVLEPVVRLLGDDVPVGADLVFRCDENPDFAVHAEVCEDVWTPIPPSTYAALGGATVLCNLSASNITIAKAGYRHQLAGHQSAKTFAAYLYSAAGVGESTNDVAWDGHGIIYENGELLAETERFQDASKLITADVDLDRLVQERSRFTSFVDSATDHADRVAGLREIGFSFEPAREPVALRRRIPRHPYVPSDPATRDERCEEAYRLQVSALVQRLRASGIAKLVIGVSGGLDSTQALLVACRAMDELKLPRTNILAYTMPGYATSDATKSNAWALMEALEVHAEEIDIRPSCEQMFKDIGHPFADGEPVHDVTFENVQAGERTSHLFRLANHHGALVLGTGDLSELALGWCTYGVGDHMSHYNVNASVPKTLIRYLIEWESEHAERKPETREVLRRIVDTEISPELVPGDDADGGPAQRTEQIIGPYELHDFSLYHVTRRGYRPAKVAFLAIHAWAASIPADKGRHYTRDEVLAWLRVFLDRFFRTSQFKRTCAPNGPKVGSGGSLSPRGDWRAPSDNVATPWLDELDAVAEWIERTADDDA